MNMIVVTVGIIFLTFSLPAESNTSVLVLFLAARASSRAASIALGFVGRRRFVSALVSPTSLLLRPSRTPSVGAVTGTTERSSSPESVPVIEFRSIKHFSGLSNAYPLFRFCELCFC